MSGLSEINILDDLNTVNIGTGSQPSTPVISKQASSATDRVVPMDDLNLLMDPTKTKSDERISPKISTTPTLTIQKPNHEPTTTSSSMKSFLNETTDLSDILGKKELKSPSNFSFTPSINVSTNATLPTPTVAAPSVSQSKTTVGSTASVASTSAQPPSTKNNGLWSSLFGTPAAPGSAAPAQPSLQTNNNAQPSVLNTPASRTATNPILNTTSKPANPPTPIKTEAEIQREKQDLLFKLNRLRERGMPVSKKYTMSSPLDEIKMEFLNLKEQRDIHNSVKFQRKMMMALVTGVEFVNTKFDPFDVRLDGWSESVHENVNDYDEIFEELHEKHKEKAKMAPEAKLFFSLAGSAFMFHLTQSLFKTSPPAMADVMHQNPEMMKQFAQAAVGAQQQQMNGGYGAQPAPSRGGGGGGMGDLFSGLMGGGGLGGLMGAMGGLGGNDGGASSENGSSYGASEIKRQEMSGPKGVDDILSQLSVPPKPQNTASFPPATTQNNISDMDTASLVKEISTSIDTKTSNQRLASVTKATPSDMQQHGHTIRKLDTASSGYRRKVTDGMKLNI